MNPGGARSVHQHSRLRCGYYHRLASDISGSAATTGLMPEPEPITFDTLSRARTRGTLVSNRFPFRPGNGSIETAVKVFRVERSSPQWRSGGYVNATPRNKFSTQGVSLCVAKDYHKETLSHMHAARARAPTCRA